MSLSPVKLTTLPQADPVVEPQTGRPTRVFLNFINGTIRELKRSIGGIQDAIDAAAAANTAAATANAAAGTAQSAATGVTAQAVMSDSYPSGLTITATDVGASVTIAISAHTRHYPQPNGTDITVGVNSGSLTGKAYSTSYWIYYDDASHAGGAVSYQATTTQATSAQVGDRHAVGAVLTPAATAGPVTGKYRTPGVVAP